MSEAAAAAAAAANASRKASELPAQAQSASSPIASHEVAIPSSDGRADESSSPAKEQDTPRAETAREITSTVTYPQLPVLPSSASSVRSGRQPDNDITIDWRDDDLMQRSEDLGEDLPMVDDSHIDTTINDATPTKLNTPAQDTDASSPDPFASSPLPTLEEIFSTASQARSTQSPVMTRPSAALNSRNPGAKRDLEYEEMMRRIDDSELGWEDDQAQVKKDLVGNQLPSSSVDWDEKLGRIKQERYSQSVTEAKNKKASLTKLASFRKAVSPPTTSQPKSIKVMKQEYASSQSQPVSQPRKRRTTAPPAKFSIPEGSQVVTLLTSSPEPEVEEHYAEDSIDSTYEGSEAADSDLPDGSGWVRKAVFGKGKGKKKGGDEAVRKRGVSLSALPASRENAGGGKRPSSSAIILPVKPGRGRRKASAKF
ncbi:hypothetical protein GE09DRAFT_1152104 [Coniochaeta sp. 2T2.1]|nr:hypothetical protein GE09DRAFT_1152104 [Coniochaeta sp. 2T2.1]